MLKSWDWVIFLLFGCLVFFHFRGFDFLEPRIVAPNDERQSLLFFLDFEDFSCMMCLDSFLGLYQKLPFRFKTSNSWGILVVKKSEGEENRLVRIAKKKLEGFVQANHITFPILVDRSQVFGELAERGSGVVLFDENRKAVFRYDFPLTNEQFEDIFANLME